MKKLIAIIACLLMINMVFVSCDKNDNVDNNGVDTTEVTSEIVTESETLAGGEAFINDNEAVYKDSWK